MNNNKLHRIFCFIALHVFTLTVQAAGPIDNGGAVTGTITFDGQVDAWTFSTSSAGTIRVQIGVTDTSGFNPLIRLLDSTNTEVASRSAGAKLSTALEYAATQADNYTIEVLDNTVTPNGTGTYNLYLAMAPGPFMTPVGDQGGNLTNGGTHPGTLDLGDMDMWAIHVNALESVYVQVGETGGAGIKPDLTIYGPDGSEIATHGNDNIARVNFQAVAAGTYTLLLRDSTSDDVTGSGDYQLYYARTPDRPSDSYTVPTGDQGGPLTNGGIHAGTIDLGDMDVWTFDASANDTIFAQIGEVGATNFQPHLLLFGPDGHLVAYNSGAASTQVSHWVGDSQTSHPVRNQASVTGTYTLIVKDASAAGDSGDYQLYFARIPGNYDVPAGDQGGPLTNGGVHIGTIDLADMDLWTFHADAKDSIQADVTKTGMNTLGPQIILFGPDGKEIAKSNGSTSASISKIVPISGMYTLLIRDKSSNVANSGDYSLSFSLTPNSTPVPSGVIISTLQDVGHVSGALDPNASDIVDKYSLDVEAGEHVRLQVGDSSNNATFLPRLQVFSSDGSLIADAGPTNKIARADFKAEANDTLTVAISEDGDNDAESYDLYSAVISPNTVIATGNESGPLVNGSLVFGSWEPTGDMDLYTLAVDQGDEVRIQLAEYITSSAGNNPKLEVFASNGTLLATSSQSKVARVAFTAQTTETLTIITRNDSDGDTADYSLDTSVVPQGFITPTGDEGGILTDGSTVNGTWDPRSDMDLYTYSNLAGSAVSITLECTSSCGSDAAPVLLVHADDGRLLGVASSGAASSTYHVTLDYTAQANDTLYLLVLNNAGDNTIGETSTYNLTASGITSLDSDSDGLSDALEALIGTDKSITDTDGDGISDYDELNYDGDPTSYDPANDLNPLSVDTDGDGVDDFTEITEGTDPLVPFLPGDVNLNGLVNLGDYVKLIQFVLGVAPSPSTAAITAGDLNGNSTLDTGDIVIYPRIFLGLN